MEKSDKVTIKLPFVSWYCQGVYIIDPSRQGSVQVSHSLECDVEDDDKTWLTNVYVAVLYRHKGIATRCINAAKQYCQDKGINKLYLWCSENMIEFYERFDFTNTNHTELDAKGRKQYFMVCDLKK